jgi:hypothetical protein
MIWLIDSMKRLCIVNLQYDSIHRLAELIRDATWTPRGAEAIIGFEESRWWCEGARRREWTGWRRQKYEEGRYTMHGVYVLDGRVLCASNSPISAHPHAYCAAFRALFVFCSSSFA